VGYLAAGREDRDAAERDSRAVQSPPAPAAISPETVSQAGAGALLLAVAVVELWLAFGAAGWWHRGGASLVAVAGGALLARALAAVALRLHAEPARHARRRESARSHAFALGDQPVGGVSRRGAAATVPPIARGA
jgi:hypothetical protein